jgi:hypothetical protein
MKKIFILFLCLGLGGCATETAYMNKEKPIEEVQKDKADCQSLVDGSDYSDADLKKNKFNQCMKDKGYEVTSLDKAQKMQGFAELWVKPGVDFKAYEAILIDRVNLEKVKIDNAHIPDLKVSDEDINNLGEEMFKRFSETLGVVMPVIQDRQEATGKKVLYLNLKLNKISHTNVGANAALQVVGHFTPIPLPSAPQGAFSFSGEISDYSSKEKLITVSDEIKSDKNASLVGTENFEQWKHAYNIMDYWADHLAALLAKERDQEYKSKLGIKLIDF